MSAAFSCILDCGLACAFARSLIDAQTRFVTTRFVTARCALIAAFIAICAYALCGTATGVASLWPVAIGGTAVGVSALRAFTGVTTVLKVAITRLTAGSAFTTIWRTLFSATVWLPRSIWITILSWAAVLPFAKAGAFCAIVARWAVLAWMAFAAFAIFTARAVLAARMPRTALFKAVVFTAARWGAITAGGVRLMVARMKAAARCVLMWATFAVRRLLLPGRGGRFQTFNDAFFHLLICVALNAHYAPALTYVRKADG